MENKAGLGRNMLVYSPTELLVKCTMYRVRLYPHARSLFPLSPSPLSLTSVVFASHRTVESKSGNEQYICYSLEMCMQAKGSTFRLSIPTDKTQPQLSCDALNAYGEPSYDMN